MKFSEARDLMVNNKTEFIMNIVHDVYWSISGGGHKVTDEEFNLLCAYVQTVYDDVEKSYTQLIADIVCDCYLDCGYGHREKCKLTKNDLQKSNKTEKIVDIYNNKYYAY